MIVELIKLFLIFFKVGLFTIGGGLAAIPLIQEEVITRGWLSTSEFTNMIAISQSTPGPIGVNVATFVGFSQYGALGSIFATLGIVAPSVIIIIIISHFLSKFRKNKYVEGVFVGVRPAVTALILFAAYIIAKESLVNLALFESTNKFFDLFNIKAIIMFLVFLFISNKWKHHPVLYIVIAGVIGIFIF
ncbi:chromate transporter [Candidatus Izemoplasma sp. B36]|uniref:chromate transporter n=1 Tax=Candidatus Izemoplasma sp. B36 TaxID=3242468 RepID=UPI003557EABA